MNRRLAATRVRSSNSDKWRSIAPTEPPANTPPADPPAPDDAPADPPAPGKVYDQDAVTAMMTREKSQGRRAGASEILQELGFTNADEAKAWTQQRREEEAAKLTDAERRQREADTSAAQAAEDRKQAAADRLAAKTERALTRAGVNDNSRDDALRLVSITPDADDEAITAAVDALKGRQPAFFQSTPAAPSAPSGGPQGTPPRPTPSGDSYQRGVERAKALAGTQ